MQRMPCKMSNDYRYNTEPHTLMHGTTYRMSKRYDTPRRFGGREREAGGRKRRGSARVREEVAAIGGGPFYTSGREMTKMPSVGQAIHARWHEVLTLF